MEKGGDIQLYINKVYDFLQAGINAGKVLICRLFFISLNYFISLENISYAAAICLGFMMKWRNYSFNQAFAIVNEQTHGIRIYKSKFLFFYKIFKSGKLN